MCLQHVVEPSEEELHSGNVAGPEGEAGEEEVVEVVEVAAVGEVDNPLANDWMVVMKLCFMDCVQSLSPDRRMLACDDTSVFSCLLRRTGAVQAQPYRCTVAQTVFRLKRQTLLIFSN